MRFLSESKRSDVAKKLKQKYQYDGAVIERILDSDPTGSKYVEYLGKMFDQYVSSIGDGKGGLSVPLANFIESKLRTWVQWFNSNIEKITSEDIEKAASRYDGNKPLTDIQKIIKNPKDVNNYTNYDFFEFVIEQVDSKKTKSEREKEAKSQAEKIYEDDKYLVIRPLTHSSSCYYGRETKWCTSSEGYDTNFLKYLKRGKLYYLINKQENFKYALFKPSDGKAEVYNSADINVDISELFDEFPDLKNLIEEIGGVSHFPKALRAWVRGLMSTDELLDIEPTLMSPGLGVKGRSDAQLTFEFQDDEEFLKLLDISEDDIWFMRSVENNYSSYEFIDPYTTEQDFFEGYGPWSYIDKENLEKLEQISMVLSGKKYDVRNPDTDFIKLLHNTFESECEDLINEYHWRMEDEMRKTAQESISDEMSKFMEKIGFKMVRDYDRVSTTPGNIVVITTQYKMEKADIKDIIKKVAEKNGSDRLGGWYENQYEFRDSDNFDSEGFERVITRRLDDILEKLDRPDVKEKTDKITKLTNRFNFDKNYSFPTNKKIQFEIKKYDFDNDKLSVVLKGKVGYKSIKISIESFLRLIDQPTLFDLEQILPEY